MQSDYDLWQQLELVSELKSDLWNTIDWNNRNLLVNVNAGKTQLVAFVRLNNCGAVDVKMNGSIAKTAFKKIKTLIVLWSFFLLRLLFISINLPHGHAWNTVVLFILIIFLKSYANENENVGKGLGL